MVRELGLPHGIVINRSDIGDNRTEEYCRQQDLDILMKIPYDRRIAEAYSRGEMMSAVSSEFQEQFGKLYQDIAERVEA